jgi:diguanylate cyclase (GGDEF)-like protein
MDSVFQPDGDRLHDKRSIVSIWLGGALVVILVTWLVVLIKISYDLQELRSRGADRAADLAATYAEQVHRTVKEIDQIGLTVKYQWQNSRMPLDLVDQYEKAMHHTPTYPAAIGIDGKAVSSWRQASIGLDFGAVDFFSYHRSSNDSALRINPPSGGLGGLQGKEVIRFTRRVNDVKGNFSGVVLVSTEPSYLASLNYRDELHKGDFVSLRLVDGPPLATTTANGPVNSVSHFLIAPQFESDEGVRSDPAERFNDRLGRYVAWKKINGYPLVVLAAVTEASAVKSYAGTKTAYLLFAIINTALVILVAVFGCSTHIKNRERRLRAERVRMTFRLAVEGAHEAFYMIDLLRAPDGSIRDCSIEDCNERAAKMNGMPQSQMIRKRFSELYDESTLEKLLKLYDRCYNQGFLEHEFYVRENSQHQAGWFLRRAVRSGEGIAVTVRDITVAKLHEENQIKLGFTDTLTGLPNRRWLNDFLPDALLRARTTHKQLALLFIDLDNFKNINDTLGHAAGDELLIAAATCLKAALRSVDHVARLGGDEFTVIVENQESSAGAELIAEELIRMFAESEVFERWKTFNVRCSIGVALFPTHAEDASSLLRCADEAMYEAKAAGKGCYRVFNQTTIDHGRTGDPRSVV